MPDDPREQSLRDQRLQEELARRRDAGARAITMNGVPDFESVWLGLHEDQRRMQRRTATRVVNAAELGPLLREREQLRDVIRESHDAMMAMLTKGVPEDGTPESYAIVDIIARQNGAIHGVF